MMTLNEAIEKAANLDNPKFKYGDQVSTVKTGFPGVGRIIAQEPAIFFSIRQNGFPQYWMDLFPNIVDSHVYVVYFETPRKNMTYEEYRNYYKDAWKEEAIQKGYEQVPEYNVIHYPEDDLELFE